MKEETNKLLLNLIYGIIIIFVIVGISSPMKVKILDVRGIKYNHCLEEESYYYRMEEFFIFTSKIKTTKEQSDGIDYKCTKWEEEPIWGKLLLGQKLIYNKGNLEERK